MYKLFSNFSTLSGLVTEMIQATGDVGTQCILDLCRPNSVVKEGCILEDWKSRECGTINLQRKGDPVDCGSYRGITSLEHATEFGSRLR